MNSPLIDETERDDFYAAAKRLGYDPQDFEVSTGPRKDIDVGDGFYLLRQDVFVKRLSNDVTRQYEGGHGHAWSATATFDLQDGLFGAK